jgi:hypothetical protein
MIADLLQHRHDLDVLQEAFGNLLPLGILRKVGEAEDLSFARQGKFWIESGPVDFVAQFNS